MSSSSSRIYPPTPSMQYPLSTTSTSYSPTLLPSYSQNPPDQSSITASSEPTKPWSAALKGCPQYDEVSLEHTQENRYSGSSFESPLLPPVIVQMSSNVDTVHTDTDETERQCRICFETSDNKKSESGRLISPCLCKGSSKYIHLGCLEKWRTASPKKESYFSCDTCHYHYSFSRPWMSKVLSNAWFVPILTVSIILGIWIGGTFGGHVLEADKTWEWKKILRKNPTPDTPRLDWMDFVFGLGVVGILGWIFILIGVCAYCSGLSSNSRSNHRGSSTNERSSGRTCRGGGGSYCTFVDCDSSDDDCGSGAIFVLIFIGVCGAFIGLYVVLSTGIGMILDSMKESILEVKH